MILSAGQKWAWLKKEYLHSGWTSDANIWITGGQGGDISVCKRILLFLIFDQFVNDLKMAKLLSCSS